MADSHPMITKTDQKTIAGLMWLGILPGTYRSVFYRICIVGTTVFGKADSDLHKLTVSLFSNQGGGDHLLEYMGVY